MTARKAVKKKAVRKPAQRTKANAKPKKKAVSKRQATKARSTAKTSPRKTSATKAPARRKVVKKQTAASALGRPRVAGTAELDLMFRNDREAREVCEFLGVKTLKELEALTPAEIVERLTAPVVRTVGRIRKALALNNRCLAGDQKFAVAFKRELS